MKSKDVIQKEIEKLKAMRPTIRHYTAFGGDNWSAVDAQVKALTEGMDEEEIWREWPENELDEVGQSEHEAAAAFEAVDWAADDGDEYPAPSAEWVPLVVTP